MDTKYLPPKVVIKQYGISRSTLALWAKEGKIRALRVGSGITSAHRYHEGDLRAHLGVPTEEETDHRDRMTILYARVSSAKQKEDGHLQRQIDLLKQTWPVHNRIITDVSSGLNFKRSGLISLLELIESNRALNVVVTQKDRLARFGIELIERAIRKHGATLHVISRGDPPTHDDTAELAEDLLTVSNYFATRNSEKRAASQRRSRQQGAPVASLDPSTEFAALSNSSDSEGEDPSSKRQRPGASIGTRKSPTSAL